MTLSAMAILTLLNPVILGGFNSINSDGNKAPLFIDESQQGLSNAPAAPQSAEAAIDTLDGILSQTCQAAYLRGRRLSDSWQQQVAAQGPEKYASDLIAFRAVATQCIAQIGDLINHTDATITDIPLSVAGTWTFAPTLWIATNDFADAVASDPSQSLTERIAKATSKSQNFAVALNQFSDWITQTQDHLSTLRSHRNGAPQ